MKKEDTSGGLASLRIPGKITFYMFLTLLILMSLIFGFMTFSYLLAILTGAMLALLCWPLLRKLVNHKVSPRIASILLTFAIVLLAVIPIFFFLFLTIKQGISVAQTLASQQDFSADGIMERLSRLSIVEKIFSSPQDAKSQFHEYVQKIGAYAAAGIVSIVSHIPNTLLQIVLIIISFFYFLIDGPRFISWLYDRIPLDIEVRKKVAKTFVDTTISVIWATLAASAVQAAIMFAAFITLSVPGIFLATAATFVLAWVPLIGSTPVWIAGALYLYFQGSWTKAILMLLFGIITGLSDNLVRPLVLKGRSNMHPLVSLLAIFGGIAMFGILGVFIGPVVAAVLISLLQILPVMEKRVGLIEAKKSKI